MTTLANSGALWKEPSSVALAARRMYLVRDGAGDWVYDATGPAEADWIDWAGNGESELLELTPARIVADGADLLVTTSAASPVAAIIIADGADYLVSTDLTQAEVADLYVDGAGNLVVVPRSAARRTAIGVGDSITII